MARHPLEPLGEDEFRSTAAILRREQSLSESWRFASIELFEPPKAEVKAWREGDPVRRTAFAVLWNRADNQTWEGVVDLTDDAVLSWTHVPGVTPHFTVDEYHEVDEAMRAHPDVIAALADRGITDMSLVTIEVWTYGKALMVVDPLGISNLSPQFGDLGGEEVALISLSEKNGGFWYLSAFAKDAQPGHGKIRESAHLGHRQPAMRRNQVHRHRRILAHGQHDLELAPLHLLGHLIGVQPRDTEPAYRRRHGRTRAVGHQARRELHRPRHGRARPRRERPGTGEMRHGDHLVLGQIRRLLDARMLLEIAG